MLNVNTKTTNNYLSICIFTSITLVENFTRLELDKYTRELPSNRENCQGRCTAHIRFRVSWHHPSPIWTCIKGIFRFPGKTDLLFSSIAMTTLQVGSLETIMVKDAERYYFERSIFVDTLFSSKLANRNSL